MSRVNTAQDIKLVFSFFTFISLGFYMFIDASSSAPGRKARLLSPQQPKTPSKCLEFWYHMYGSNTGSLNVYKKTGSSVGVRIWSESGDQGNEWLIVKVAVWSPLRPFQLSFEGVVGSGGGKGDIAIDDVRLLDGKCPPQGQLII